MTGKKTLRIVFAGGGTGGHLYPALAVADRLKSRHPGLEILFIGTRYGIESRVVPEAGYKLRKILSRGARGRGLAGQVLTMANLLVGIVQSAVTLGRFKPDLVFGCGGYASAAAIIAAFILRQTIVIQEQNSIPGLVNRKLASLASRIYLGFGKAEGYLGGHTGVLVTGNPLRGKIASPDPDGTQEEFGLGSDKVTLLVFGGSQGARTLNRAATDYILSREDLQAIVQTGKRDYEEISERLSGVADRVYVSEYIENIEAAYAKADVALARSGALSISELIAVRLPSILVPYPYSADDHQVHNAGAVVEGGGAVMIMNDELDAKSLGEAVEKITGEGGLSGEMKKNLGAMDSGDATGTIVKDIEGLVLAGEGDSDAR